MDKNKEDYDKNELLLEYKSRPHEMWGCDKCREQTIHIKEIVSDQQETRYTCTICNNSIILKPDSDNEKILIRQKHYINYHGEKHEADE